MRGMVLAGGKGTRLGELTRVTNKHLLPVGPYPMVYHPIKKLIGAGIRDIMLISGTEHMGDFVELLGSGSRLGCRITYRVQDEAGGIAQALGLAADFGRDSRVTVLLGDNIFRPPLIPFLKKAEENKDYAWITLHSVEDPERFGVAEFDGNNRLVNLQEKPKKPKSSFAVVGIYIYPPDVYDIIAQLKPSARNELEITEVNQNYLKQGRLGFSILEGYWSDAGTLESLFHANQLVHTDNPLFESEL